MTGLEFDFGIRNGTRKVKRKAACEGGLHALRMSGAGATTHSHGLTCSGSFLNHRMPDIYEFLHAHGIAFQRCDHPAVFTVAEVKLLVPPLDGTHTKNLFLRDKKGRRHVLVVVGSDKQVDIKGLCSVLGLGHLSFGSPERLKKHLGIEPGSVSLLALLNDANHDVEVFIDRELWSATALQCHPLVNTTTLVISREGIERFLQATGHPYRLVDVPTATATRDADG